MGSLEFSRERSTEWLHCHLDQLSGHLSDAQDHAAMKGQAAWSNAAVPEVVMTVEMVTTILVEAAGGGRESGW